MQTSFGSTAVSLGGVDINPHGDKDMTTGTMLLNAGLAAGTSGLVATAMTIVPNLDHARVARRYHDVLRRRRARERCKADLQPGV
jgi:hypothetical protein